MAEDSEEIVTKKAMASQTDNRWIKLADRIKWEKWEGANDAIEETESEYPFRLRLGCLALAYKLGLTDAEFVMQLAENPYYRYFVGLPMDDENIPVTTAVMKKFKKSINLDLSMVISRSRRAELLDEYSVASKTIAQQKDQLWYSQLVIEAQQKNIETLEKRCERLEKDVDTLGYALKRSYAERTFASVSAPAEAKATPNDFPKSSAPGGPEDLMDISGLTEEQKNVFNKAMNGENLFITGGAGTGKSYLLKRIIAHLSEKEKKVIVGAPTGMAALHVGGVTLHRLFSLPIGLVDDVYVNGGNVSNLAGKSYSVIHKADVLVIDEISMCRADAFSRIANILLYEERAGHHMQVILCGDFFQLPPVVGEREKKYFKEALKNEEGWAFLSPVWKALSIETYELTKVIRQENPKFANALNFIRQGNPKGLNYICNETTGNPPKGVMLCGKNKIAQDINEREMLSLGEKIVVFNAKVVKNTEDLDPEKEIRVITDPHIELCIGARVLVTMNDPSGLDEYHNGSMGNVVDFEDEIVKVQLDDGGIVSIPKFTYQVYDYTMTQNEDTDSYSLERKVIFSFEQIPLRLGWAITIHKSQGQTYDYMVLNTDSLWKMDGLLYVALSRVTTTKGLSLIGGHKNWGGLAPFLKASSRVRNFYSKIE